jgi:hypothetical protein
LAEVHLSRRTLGILASLAGSALGAWWWTTHRGSRVSNSQPGRDRGTVIFDNTPVASEPDVAV